MTVSFKLDQSVPVVLNNELLRSFNLNKLSDKLEVLKNPATVSSDLNVTLLENFRFAIKSSNDASDIQKN